MTFCLHLSKNEFEFIGEELQDVIEHIYLKQTRKPDIVRKSAMVDWFDSGDRLS